MGKKRFFNFKNLFFVSFLAVAGLFSAAAIIKDKQVEETPVVEKADAATNYRVYLRPSSDWKTGNADFYVYSHDSAWHKMSAVSVTGGSGEETGIYVVEYSATSSGCNFVRYNPAHDPNVEVQAGRDPWREGYKWNQTGNLTVATGKICDITDWNTGSWIASNVWMVTQKQIVGSTVYELEVGYKHVWNGCKWTAPSQSTYAGYSGDGWLDSNKSTKISVGGTKTINADVTVYSKFVRSSKNLHLRSSGTSWACDCAVTETVSFGDSYVQCSVTKALAVDEQFKLGNSDWTIKYDPSDNDSAGKTFYNWLWESRPVRCIDRTGTTSGTSFVCKVAGEYTFTFHIYADGSFTIDDVVRSPSGTKTVTYHKIIDGVDTGLGSVTLWNGYPYTADSSKVQSDVFGYTSSHWYTQPVASDEYLYVDGTSITSNINLYQIYTKLECATYYFEIHNADNSWDNGVQIYAWQTIGGTDTARSSFDDSPSYTPIYKDSSTAVVYSAYLPVPTNDVNVKVIVFVKNQGQTEDIELTTDLDEMCWQIDSYSSSLYHGDWKAFEAGYSLVDSSGILIVNMTSYEGSSNLAAVYDVSLTAGDNLKVKIDISIGSTLELNTTLYTLGSDESTTACAQVTGSNKYFTMKLTKKFNFYLNTDHIIYIENATSLETSGTIYISNGSDWDHIYVYAYYESGGEQATLGAWPGTKIDYIENISSTVFLDYQDHGNIYKLLVGKLGASATKVVFNDGTKATKASATAGTNRTGVYTIPSSSSSPDYYVDCTGSSDANLSTTTSESVAPKVAYDIETTIRNAPGQSVCNIDSVTAKSLYDRYTSVSSTIGTSTITTWTEKGSSTSKEWTITEISSQLYQKGYNASAIRTFAPFKLLTSGESDFSVIIIIIASSVSLLSVSVLSILMVKKRKSKEE